MAFFSFLDHLNFVEDDSSRYEVAVGDEGFSYLDLVSEKKARRLTFEEKQRRETSAALDGSTRARGKSNIKKLEGVDHDEVCFDTDLLAIVRDIERRRKRLSVFPWALGAACVIAIVWILFVYNARFPVLVFAMSAVLVIPGFAFALVNAWYFDRSRKDVHFAYKISGRGTTAFQKVNNAMEAISRSGQTLLFAGRRFFEDSRYTGGAASLPEFRKVRFSRGKPPLLELKFDVWHIRAFHQDLYFMPDHVLVYDGSRMGGINYAKLEIGTESEVTQARGIAAVARDAKVVGRTHRFVNNDGTPDRRFNNNTEIPLIEYGVVNLRGAGLDVSLYVTNQGNAYGVPSQMSEIRELASKPVQRISKQRRAQAAARRKAELEEVFSVVLDAMCCAMFADGQASTAERQLIQRLMQKIRSPWDESEIDLRMRNFRNRAASSGLDDCVRDVCSRASKITASQKQAALLKCLDHVIAADGKADVRETAIRNQIADAMVSNKVSTG